MDKKQETVAKFIGMQMTRLGWYDYAGVLDLPYTIDNTFDTLQFDSDWDWLISALEYAESLATTLNFKCLSIYKEMKSHYINYNRSETFESLYLLIMCYNEKPKLCQTN